MRLHLLQGVDLVAVHGRHLELQAPGSTFHAGDQARQDFLVAALEEQDRITDLIGIVRRLDQAHARRRTASDLVLQARPAAMREITVFTVPDPEKLLDQIDAFANGFR